MPNVFQRSWAVAKTSFGVVKQDKEMILYPVFSAIFSLAFLIAMLFPTIFVDYVGQNANADGHAWEIIDYVLIFITYYGLAFVATFFNVCVVYTAKTRFEGGNATLGSSFRFAMSKIGQIAAWAFLSAVVGLILAIIQNAFKKAGPAGRAAGNIGARVGQAAWSIMTIFVIPVMVYHRVGPGEAIKASWATLKKTWGESIVRYFGMGLIGFLFGLLGLAIAIGVGFLLYAPIGVTGIFVAIIAFVIYVIILALVFSVATQVYNTALFVYAETGNTPTGYTPNTMQMAFN